VAHQGEAVLPGLQHDMSELKRPAGWSTDQWNEAQRLLVIVAAAAKAEQRCPTYAQLPPVRFGINLQSMALAGLLHIEVYGRNFRRAWICAGPDRGLSTLPPPFDPEAEPYLVTGPGRPLP